MDQLRARAFLDFTLGVSSFPPPASQQGSQPAAPRTRPRPGQPRGPHPASGPARTAPARPAGGRPGQPGGGDTQRDAPCRRPGHGAAATPSPRHARPGPGGPLRWHRHLSERGMGAQRDRPGTRSQPSPGSADGQASPAAPAPSRGPARTVPAHRRQPATLVRVPRRVTQARRGTHRPARTRQPGRHPAGPAGDRPGRADQPDHPAGHPARPGRPARRRPRPRPHRPRPRPHPRQRRRHQPPHQLVPDHHRPARPPHRPRLRTPRTTRPASRDRRKQHTETAPPSPHEDDHGPPGPGGHGRWRLTTPGPAGRDYSIDIGPLAVTGCDHRDESAGYQPSDRLRHLVEIRDGECTWPPCRRHARACDFEHAVPYDQGGRTCACNAGARCRHHHHAKQAPGWRLHQHQPGHHTWTTPSGRTYTTGPTQYPI